MEMFEKISLNQVVWYMLPGAIFLFVVLLQVSLVYTSEVYALIDKIGIINAIAISIIMGFLLDGLRLYRLKPNFQKIKKDFYLSLQRLFHSEQDAKYILDYILKSMTSVQYNSVRFYHSMWIMNGQVSISLLIASSIIWCFMLLSRLIYHLPCVILGYNVSLRFFTVFCILFWIVSVIIGLRIMFVSTQGQKNCNNMYYEFAVSNKKQIKEALKYGYIKKRS